MYPAVSSGSAAASGNHKTPLQEDQWEIPMHFYFMYLFLFYFYPAFPWPKRPHPRQLTKQKYATNIKKYKTTIYKIPKKS